MSSLRALRLLLAVGVVGLLGACAHPLSLDPLKTPPREETRLIAKKVGYVMTDTDRAKQVTTPGGGGDQLSYFPYRDMEKPIREALRSVYQDVTSVPGAGEDAARAANVAYVFAPQITTTSSSPSAFTWPPTKFGTELSCTVTDAQGTLVAQFRVSGNGVAEFDEFKSDHSLAARRSVLEVADRFAQAIRENPKLK